MSGPDTGADRAGQCVGLGALQTVFARLCADPELRSLFFTDPVPVGRERLGLDSAEAERCAQLLQSEVDQFARALLRKRLGQVAVQIPLTVSGLGAEFRPLFQVYAEKYPRPETRTRHGDALGFLSWLREELRRKGLLKCADRKHRPEWLLDIARLEQARLRAFAHWERSRWPALRVLVFRHRMKQLIRTLTTGEIPRPDARGWGLGLWLQLPPPGGLRHFLLP